MDLSLAASAIETLRLSPTPRLLLLEARTLASAHVPPYPPDMPVLLTGVDSPELAAHIREVLLTVYPRKHEVSLVVGDRLKVESLVELQPSTFDFRPSTVLYVPALTEGTAFESFHEIVARLRAPDGCPWDREQTHQSLRTHLLEESYEALEAIDSDDPASMREEFGDLLLQVVLQAQIASEAGHFTMTDVVKGIYDKIVRRHPHVFGDVELKDVNGVLQNWEKLKEKERGKKKEDKGLLDGVPLSLPALTQSQEYQDRAARVGFDWPEIEGVLEKIAEEVEEVKRASDEKELASEIGDLLFALVNLARWKKVDAESVLRETNARFKRRFAFIEKGAREQGRNLSELSLDEMEFLWQQAKKLNEHD
ncbi:MAG: nucleoside triphosphate pyrophosphohydrolase [Chloroflexota bacterium]